MRPKTIYIVVSYSLLKRRINKSRVHISKARFRAWIRTHIIIWGNEQADDKHFGTRITHILLHLVWSHMLAPRALIQSSARPGKSH